MVPLLFYFNALFVRKILLGFLLPPILTLNACQQKKPSLIVADYFASPDSGIQSAGIKMIPIKTPVGNFKA